MSNVAHRIPGETFAGYTQLVVKTCGTCGVVFAIPDALEDECRQNHNRSWYCPNGHDRHYIGKTEAEKLRESLERERARAGRYAAERDQTEARLRAQKGATTKLRKRIAAGCCPVCRRNFQALADHIASQHPDFRDATDG